MRVIVSGVNGFVGGHLTRELTQAGHSVIGLGLGPPRSGIAPLLAQYVACDLTQGWPEVDADAIVHLAALSAVGPSFEDPQRYITTNSSAVTHMAETLLASGRHPRVLLVSTGAVYAPGTHLSETSPTQPSSPYAVSKLVTELQAAYYRQRGLDMVVMRPFNHHGPEQRTGFLLADLSAGVREARSSGTPLRVGNLATRRDYTDVRDVARAYRAAIESSGDLPPLLNVCSGKSHSGNDLLDLVLAELGEVAVAVDESRLRPGDPAEITGDATLIGATLGWEPRIALEQTVHDYLHSPL